MNVHCDNYVHHVLSKKKKSVSCYYTLLIVQMDFYYTREYFLLNRNVKLKSYLCTSLALSVASEFVICSHYFADSLLKCDIYIKIELGE